MDKQWEITFKKFRKICIEYKTMTEIAQELHVSLPTVSKILQGYVPGSFLKLKIVGWIENKEKGKTK